MRREQLERLLCQMLPLRRLLRDRVARLLEAPLYVDEDGRSHWLEEEEYREELKKLERVHRVVLSLYRLLGARSDWEPEEGAAQLAA